MNRQTKWFHTLGQAFNDFARTLWRAKFHSMAIFYYILWTLSLAFCLSVVRWAEMIFFGLRGNSGNEALQIIITGFRFDLMVVGFWLSPVVVYFIFSELFSKQNILKPAFARIYLLLSWAFICLLYLKDLISFAIEKDRLWLADHLSHPIINFEHANKLEWWAWVGIIFLAMGLFQAGALQFSRFVQRFQNLGLLTIGLILFWTAFIARGTLTAHHLRRKDCQFSTNAQVEAICLNPVFTFSKDK